MHIRPLLRSARSKHPTGQLKASAAAKEGNDPVRIFVLLLRSRRITADALRRDMDTLERLRREAQRGPRRSYMYSGCDNAIEDGSGGEEEQRRARDRAARGVGSGGDGATGGVSFGIGETVTRCLMPVLEAQLRGSRQWCDGCLSLTPGQNLELCSGCAEVGYCCSSHCSSNSSSNSSSSGNIVATGGAWAPAPAHPPLSCQKQGWTQGGHQIICRQLRKERKAAEEKKRRALNGDRGEGGEKTSEIWDPNAKVEPCESCCEICRRCKTCRRELSATEREGEQGVLTCELENGVGGKEDEEDEEEGSGKEGNRKEGGGKDGEAEGRKEEAKREDADNDQLPSTVRVGAWRQPLGVGVREPQRRQKEGKGHTEEAGELEISKNVPEGKAGADD